MNLSAPQGVSLRPYLPEDLPRLGVITRAAIEELAAEDYDAEQRAVWASSFEDEARFGAKLESYVVLLAVAGDTVAGYVALKDEDLVELLYVAPEFARQGIATFLCRAIELLAAGRKATKLRVQASDTAQPLFETLGYTPKQRNTVSLHGQWLANTTMEKTLQPDAAGRSQ